MHNAARLQELSVLYSKKKSLLDQLRALQIKNTAKNFRPYEYQRTFYEAGLSYKDRRLMAGNRVGKTRGIGFEFRCHATADYPEDWPGYKFKHPITSWAMGVSNEQIRDVIQKHLFGRYNSGTKKFEPDETVPPFFREDEIVKIVPSSQTQGLAKDVYVKSKAGGTSIISFKSYEQGDQILMGNLVDLIWVDEEAKKNIMSQIEIRLMNGCKGEGGHLICTFTPEKGMTEQVSMLLKRRPPEIYLQKATWDDAPHLTEKIKKEYLSKMLPWQRDMRSKGVPVRGEGRIWEYSRDDIMYARNLFPGDRFPGHFRHILGHDFGWTHPQAWAFMAIDPDNDAIYVYRTIRFQHKKPEQVIGLLHSIKAAWLPIAWPADGEGTEKGAGEKLCQQYRDCGFNMLDEHATHEIESAKARGISTVSVWGGVLEMDQRFGNRTLMIKEGQEEAFEEFENYYQEDGKIIKLDDDILAAIRYGMMMKRFAIRKPITRQDQDRFMYESKKQTRRWY